MTPVGNPSRGSVRARSVAEAPPGSTDVRGRDVVVCTLTDRGLARGLSRHPRVARTGTLATANLGIERLVLGVVALEHVSHLVVCGRESRLFRCGQSLLALAAHGIQPDGRIIGALGYRPHVSSLRPRVVSEFRRTVTTHDLTGEADPDELSSHIDALPRCDHESNARHGHLGAHQRVGLRGEIAASQPDLVTLPAGGRRSPIATAGHGFFVVSIDREARVIVLRQYNEDLRSGYEMRSHRAEALLHGAVAHGLVVELTHAGYLGGELAKAEAALGFGIDYVQDRRLA